MKAIVDRDTCIGCELCPQLCPEVFEMDADGKAVAVVDMVPDDVEDACRDAAQSCPVAAIRLE